MAIPKWSNGHAPDQSYIFLKVFENSISGLVELEVDDVNNALGLELKKGITPEELEPYADQIKGYILERLAFSTGGKDISISFTEIGSLELELGTYCQFRFDLEGLSTVPDDIDVKYNAVFDNDPKHQGMLVIEYNWKAGIMNNEALVSLVFSSSNTKQNLDLTDGSLLKGFLTMIWLGIWHIFIGTDHILFLLALLLPAVVYRFQNDDNVERHYESVTLPGFGTFNNWNPVGKFKPAVLYVLVIVSFFTISHCITLTLAAFEIVVLPSRLVESIIAISIALAAIHNIRPLFKRDWLIAFGFGFFHGFGFASVLGDIGLKGEYMALSLLGFNIGVELGQIVIICIFFPILYLLKDSKNYSKILVYGSVLLILISLYWFVERAFDYDMPIDDFISDFIDRVIKKIKMLMGIEIK